MMHVARRHDVDEIGAFYAECFALDLSTRVVMALGRNGYRQFAAVAHDRERLPMLRGFGAKAVAEIDRVLAVYCPLPVRGRRRPTAGPRFSRACPPAPSRRS